MSQNKYVFTTVFDISNDPVFHGKTNHFKIKLHQLQDKQKNGETELTQKEQGSNNNLNPRLFKKLDFKF